MEPAMVGALAWTPLLAALTDRLWPYLPVLGLLLIILSLFMSLRKRRRGGRAEPTAREQLERGKQEQGMRDDLQSLMVEIEQMAKRLSSQIDSKTLRLEKLLAEADRRIERLEQLTGQSTGEPTRQADTDDPAMPSARAGENGNAPASTPADGADATDPPGDTSVADSRRGPGASPARATSSPASSTDPPPPGSSDDPLTRSIYELADAGKAAQQIAAELNEHIGKVELILALRRT